MSGQDHAVALGAILEALAREIDGPRQAILAAEHHLAAALRSGSPIAEAASNLQSIDLALQILGDIEGFVRRLASGLPADLRIDAGPALGGLTLDRVTASLGAALGAEVPSLHSQPPIELF